MCDISVTSLSGWPVPLLVGVVGGVAGMLGSLFFILSYIGLPALRTPSRGLLLWLSTCDFLQGLWFVTAPIAPCWPMLCRVQWIMGIFAASSSFLWTASISVYILLVVRAQSRVIPHSVFVTFHVISWGIPIIICGTVGIWDRFDLKDSSRLVIGVLWPCADLRAPLRIPTYTAPLIICWLVTIFCYVAAYSRIDELSQTAVGANNVPKIPELAELQTKFILIPLAFVLLRIWGVIAQPVVELSHMTPPLWLLILWSLGDASQGFWNFVIYTVLTRRVRDEFFGVARQRSMDSSPLLQATSNPSLMYNYQEIPGPYPVGSYSSTPRSHTQYR